MEIWNIMSRQVPGTATVKNPMYQGWVSKTPRDWLRILLPDEASLKKQPLQFLQLIEPVPVSSFKNKPKFWPTTTTPSVQHITLKHCKQHDSCIRSCKPPSLVKYSNKSKLKPWRLNKSAPAVHTFARIRKACFYLLLVLPEPEQSRQKQLCLGSSVSPCQESGKRIW